MGVVSVNFEGSITSVDLFDERGLSARVNRGRMELDGHVDVTVFDKIFDGFSKRVRRDVWEDIFNGRSNFSTIGTGHIDEPGTVVDGEDKSKQNTLPSLVHMALENVFFIFTSSEIDVFGRLGAKDQSELPFC